MIISFRQIRDTLREKKGLSGENSQTQILYRKTCKYQNDTFNACACRYCTCTTYLFWWWCSSPKFILSSSTKAGWHLVHLHVEIWKVVSEKVAKFWSISFLFWPNCKHLPNLSSTFSSSCWWNSIFGLFYCHRHNLSSLPWSQTSSLIYTHDWGLQYVMLFLYYKSA